MKDSDLMFLTMVGGAFLLVGYSITINSLEISKVLKKDENK